MDRLKAIWLEYRLTLIVVAVLGVAYLFLRSPGSDAGSVEEVQALVGQGRPVVLYFFSNT